MINWTLKKFKVSDLKDFPKNARRLSTKQYDQLKQSLSKFGVIDKPICTQSGMIIGGHQRKKVLQTLGIKEIDCWVPDTYLPDKEIEELNIRLNKNTGEFDFDILANEWDPIDLVQWGFEPEELLGNNEELDKSPLEDDEILDPGKDEDAITKLGDVYDLGSNLLICGDSTNADTVASLLEKKVPILMVTDPPYGVNYDAKWRQTSLKDNRKRAKGKVQNDEQVNWKLAWDLFSGEVAYIWSGDRYAFECIKSLKESGLEIINQIIWIKQHFALSRGDYHSQHESCWYAVKKGHAHNWQGARDQATIWEIANLNAFGKNQDDERTAHSTQKPLECMARPIRNNTAKGESIYDPFLGSGTTLIAAEQLDRVCYGIELSPAYCDIIVKRWINCRKKLGKDCVVKRNGQICEVFNAS